MAPPIEVPCPQCGAAIAVSLADVQAEATVHCPAGHPLHLANEGGPAGLLDRLLSRRPRA